jgi:imidazolonepropionase-like amidohydrolase
MNRLFIYITFLIFLTNCSTRSIRTFDCIVINANIVDVQSNSLLSNRLIAINKDTIQLIDNILNKYLYKATKWIDAKNKYVMPGLWDNHVHFRGGDSLIDENKNLLLLFLKFGVTTVRDAGGDMTHSIFEWRRKIKENKLAGPTIFTPGPKLDGGEGGWAGSLKVSNAKDIDLALDSLQKIGVDYVKMYDRSLSKGVFYGIIEASKKRGLKTTGHMPMSASFLEAIDKGLNGVEHMYYTIKACSPEADSLTKLNLTYAMMPKIVETYDEQLAKSVFKKMKEKNVFITPTLFIGKILSELTETDHTKDTLLAYIGHGIRHTYTGRILSAKKAKAQGNTSRKKMGSLAMKMIAPMQKSGVSILAGSDCGPFNSFVYPGESIHEELKLLVDSGLTPQEALQTSFVNGPKFFGLDQFYGTIEKGKIADLIILDKNPLEKIENTRTVISVINRGKVYGKEKINNMLQSIKQ